MGKLEEMDKFLEKYILPTLKQEDTYILKRERNQISNNKNLPPTQKFWARWFN